MKLYVYSKCSTCKGAIKYISNLTYKLKVIDMVENRLSEKEIDNIIKISNLDINKFFNTNGIKYRELGLKDKIKNMNYNEKLKLLASDGMLIKRPIFICNNNVVLGYKEDKYKEIIK